MRKPPSAPATAGLKVVMDRCILKEHAKTVCGGENLNFADY